MHCISLLLLVAIAMATNENMDTTAVTGNEDERKLFVGGFPQDTTEAQIREHFGQLGEIETVTLKTNVATSNCIWQWLTSRSRGFCSIVYKSDDSLKAAMADEHTISNKKVFVKKTPAFAFRHSGAHNQFFCGGSILILMAAIAGTLLYKLLTLTPDEN